MGARYGNREPHHKLAADERAELQVAAGSPEFGHPPPRQSVPRPANEQRYIAANRVLAGTDSREATRPSVQRTVSAFGSRHASKQLHFGGPRNDRRRSAESISFCICS
jgi:hypothetical protein